MGSRVYPEHPFVGVGAVVVYGDRVLLIRRGREPYKGYWAVPGGVQEVGESLEDAVLRELREEVGVDGVVEGVVWVDEIIERDRGGRVKYHYVIVDLLVKPLSTVLRPSSEVLEAGWFTIDEALGLNTVGTVRRMLESFKRCGLSKALPYVKALVRGG